MKDIYGTFIQANKPFKILRYDIMKRMSFHHRYTRRRHNLLAVLFGHCNVALDGFIHKRRSTYIDEEANLQLKDRAFVRYLMCFHFITYM